MSGPIKRVCIGALLVLALSGGVRADPIQKVPKFPSRVHNPEDREFIVLSSAMWAAWTFDTITTHSAFKANPNVVEGGSFFPGSRSTPQVMGSYAALNLAVMVLSNEWRLHVRNRYLHPLWRVPLGWRIEQHTVGGVGNLQTIKQSRAPQLTITF